MNALAFALLLAFPFDLRWIDDNLDEDGTIVYRDNVEVGFVGPGLTYFFDDPPANAGDKFCWHLRVVRGQEMSSSSNIACASVPVAPVCKNKGKKCR